MTRVIGVVLAGGQARRMGGGDKGLLPLGDSTILTYVLGRLTPQVDRVALNANGDPARLEHLKLPILPDSSGSGSPGLTALLVWGGKHG